MTAREEILSPVRSALGDRPAGTELPTVPRTYRRTSDDGPEQQVKLLAGRLADYGARVHTGGPDRLAATVAALLPSGGPLAVPQEVPREWLAAYPGAVRADTDRAPLDAGALDGVAGVLTGCAAAVAETGTLVLDGGPAQGRRLLTLIPDHHVCVVRTGDVVATVPEALERLAPDRPLTLVSGLHGPRRLDVVLVR